MTQHDVPNPPTTLLGTFIVTVWHKPGTSIQEDKDKLRDGQHLVVGTPGRHLFGSGLFQARAQSIGEKRFAACQMLWVALLIVDARNPPAGANTDSPSHFNSCDIDSQLKAVHDDPVLQLRCLRHGRWACDLKLFECIIWSRSCPQICLQNLVEHVEE